MIRKVIHVLACKKHSGATRGHNHVMDVLAQLAHNTCYSVHVHHKVKTTAAASNKQGDVKLVNFGLDGSNNLVINVSISCDHIGNSTVNNGYINGKMHTNAWLQARAGDQNRNYKEDYAAVGVASEPAIVSVAGQIHPEFLCFQWGLTDKQTRNYYALIGAEERIGSVHLFVHSTAPPSRRQPGQVISSDEYLMHCAAHASHCAAPCPAPLRPAVNVDVGAPSVAPSANANRARESGEVDVVDDGTHAAGGVAASEWLAATLGGGDLKRRRWYRCP